MTIREPLSEDKINFCKAFQSIKAAALQDVQRAVAVKRLAGPP